MKRFLAVLCCALAFGKALSAMAPVSAQGPANLPIATGLSPGDVLLNDFRNGWVKYDPSLKELSSLNWPRYIEGVGKLGLDVDGSILHFVGATSLFKLNPVTGLSTPLTETGSANDFTVLPDGDILFHKPASSSSKTDGVWSGGRDSVFSRYDRSSKATTRLPKPAQFSPMSVRLGDDGEVFVHDFFRGIQQIDLAPGTLSNYPNLYRSTHTFAGVSPNGDFVVQSSQDGTFRVNPATGLVAQISDFRHSFLFDMQVDEAGGIWAISPIGFFFIDGDTGEVSSLLANHNPLSFSPLSMLVIPSDWTAPPVPEPTTLAMASMGFASMCIAAIGRARRASHD